MSDKNLLFKLYFKVLYQTLKHTFTWHLMMIPFRCRWNLKAMINCITHIYKSSDLTEDQRQYSLKNSVKSKYTVLVYLVSLKFKTIEGSKGNPPFMGQNEIHFIRFSGNVKNTCLGLEKSWNRPWRSRFFLFGSQSLRIIFKSIAFPGNQSC